MDATNVRIYRQFVYGDADNPRQIPESLEKIHNEVFALQRSYCGRSQVSVDAHTMVWLTWKYQTEEGRSFYGLTKILAADNVPLEPPHVISDQEPLPSMSVQFEGKEVEFSPSAELTPQEYVDWKTVPVGTPVITHIKNKGVRAGTYLRHDNMGRIVIRDMDGKETLVSAVRTQIANVVTT